LEIESIKGLIDKRQVAVDSVDDELRALDQQRQALVAKKQIHVEYISNHRELISPVRRLHPDILLSIFLLLVSTTPPSGQTLPPAVSISHICRQWRDLALLNPLVWAHIDINIPGYPLNPSSSSDELSLDDPRVSRWQRKVELLRTVTQAFVDRSQGCPLHVSFKAKEPSASRTLGAAHHEQGWRRVLEPLYAASNEWKSLNLCLDLEATASRLIGALKLPSLKPKGLRHLELDIFYNQVGVESNGSWKFLRDKIDLQGACLTSLTATMSASDLCRIHSQWDKLVFLSVGSTHESSRFGPYEAFNILATTPNLERCVIQFSNGAPQSMHPFRQIVRLPKLRDLTIHGPLARSEFAALLDTPSLVRLTALYTHTSCLNEGSPMVEWARRYGAQLSHVSFIYSHLTQSAFTSVLENLTNAVSLDLQAEDETTISVQLQVGPQTGGQLEETHTLLDSSLLQRLTPRLHEPMTATDIDGYDCICPKLETLLCTLGKGHSDTTKGDITEFVEARRKLGKKGGPVAWLGKVDVTFWVGPINEMLEDLQSRGVNTEGVSFKARYADERSTPCLYKLPIPGVGTISISMDHHHEH
jgi:hypothetical protein